LDIQCFDASDCPDLVDENVLYACSGIGVAGDLAPAECGRSSNTLAPINSSDALACRAEVEAQVGACQ